MLVKDISRSFFYSLKEAALLLRNGNFRGALWKVYVRNTVSMFVDIVSSRTANDYFYKFSLKKDGFAQVETLDDRLVEELTDYYLNSYDTKIPFTEFADQMSQLDVVRPDGVDLTNNKLLIKKVFERTGILKIITTHLGIKEKDLSFYAKIDALFVTHGDVLANNNYDGALKFHRDVDSRKFVKVFYYLNDVGLGNGHHEVYLGSHRNLPLSLRPLKRFSKEEIDASLSTKCKLHKVTGKAGYGWIENTTTLHSGTKPLNGPRLLLMLSFNDESSTMSMYSDNEYKLLRDYL